MDSSSEFNEKYNKWLELGCSGLDIEDKNIVNYLDYHFKYFIKYPNFMYSQIKTKFSSVRFYCRGLPENFSRKIEDTIENYLTVKYHGKF